MTDPRRTPRLSVLAVSDDSAIQGALRRTLQELGDDLEIAGDIEQALARATTESPDLLLLQCSAQGSFDFDALAELQAAYSGAVLYLLLPSGRRDLELELDAHGVAGSLVLPLTGRDLLRVRVAALNHRDNALQLAQLQADAEVATRARNVVQALAALRQDTPARELASYWVNLPALAELGNLAVYGPACPQASLLTLLASNGPSRHLPDFCEPLDLLTRARTEGWQSHELAHGPHGAAMVLFRGRGAAGGRMLRDLLCIAGPQFVARLGWAGDGQQPDSNRDRADADRVYTYAQFVDMADREVDKARRHERRLALMILNLDPSVDDGEAEANLAAQVGKGARACLRETDIVARVDQRRYCLLLAETGAIGAHACRRRVLGALFKPDPRRTRGILADAILTGIASYPQDGGSLSALMQAAQQRAHAAEDSRLRRLGLERLELTKLLGQLLAAAVPSDSQSGAYDPHFIELALLDVVSLAVAAIREALRAGEVTVIASCHTPMSLGSLLRSTSAATDPRVTLRLADLSEYPALRDLEGLVVIAEQGTYALLGRAEQGVVRAVHSADPLLGDLLVFALSRAAGTRFLEDNHKPVPGALPLEQGTTAPFGVAPASPAEERLDRVPGIVTGPFVPDTPAEGGHGRSSAGIAVDILRSLAEAGATGALQIKTTTGSAEVRLHQGQFVDAVYQRMQGAKALFRLLDEGDVAANFVSGVPCPLRRLTRPWADLLAEGGQHNEKCRQLRTALGDPEDLLQTEPRAVPQGELAARIVSALRVPCSLDELLDWLPDLDLAVLSCVRDLTELGALRRIRRGAVQVELASAAGIEALAATARQLRRPGFSGNPRMILIGDPARLAAARQALARIVQAETPLDAAPVPPIAYHLATLSLGDDQHLDVVALPDERSYRPLFGLSLPGTALVVDLDGTQNDTLSDACAAAGALQLDAAALLGTLDPADPRQMAALVVSALESTRSA